MSPRSTAMLAIFLGPAACAATQFFSYMLVYPAAASGSNAVLHLLTLIGSAVAVLGLFLSYRALERRRAAQQAEVDRFLAVTGVAINVFFLIVIVVGFGLPKLLLHATD